MAVWAFLNRDKEEVVEEIPKEVAPEDIQKEIEDVTDEAGE
jgi:hypothetical protein